MNILEEAGFHVTMNESEISVYLEMLSHINITIPSDCEWPLSYTVVIVGISGAIVLIVALLIHHRKEGLKS